MFHKSCKLILLACLLALLLGAAPAPAAHAQNNSICGLFLSDGWNTILALSPTQSVVVRPIDVDDYWAWNNLTLETYVRIYDPVYTSNDPVNGVVMGFSRVETVASCFETAATSTPTPTLVPTATFTPRPVTTSYGCANNAEQAPQCGCGVYAALQTFGGTVNSKLGKSYPTAASLAQQVYWNEGYLQYPQNGVWRYQVDYALPDDALILQPGAEYWVYPSNGKLGSSAQKTVDFGHAGIVRSAGRISQMINQKGVPGWQITLRSANWGCHAGYKTFKDGSCENVSDVKVFIQDGSAVSFWRKVSNPQFARLYSSAGKKALQPQTQDAGSLVPGAAESASGNLQTWALVRLPNAGNLKSPYYQIVNMSTGKCLDINGGGSANGTSVIQWYCHNGDNQKWLLIPTYNSYQIQSVSSGKYLTYLGQQSPSLVIWDAQNNASQAWELHRLAPGCALRAQGDANCDGKTNVTDLGLWARAVCTPSAAKPCADLSADFDFDGDVDEADKAILMKFYK